MRVLSIKCWPSFFIQSDMCTVYHLSRSSFRTFSPRTHSWQHSLLSTKQLPIHSLSSCTNNVPRKFFAALEATLAHSVASLAVIQYFSQPPRYIWCLSIHLFLQVCVCVYSYKYMYMYAHSPKKKTAQKKLLTVPHAIFDASAFTNFYMCVCVYIHIHTCICMHTHKKKMTAHSPHAIFDASAFTCF